MKIRRFCFLILFPLIISNSNHAFCQGPEICNGEFESSQNGAWPLGVAEVPVSNCWNTGQTYITQSQSWIHSPDWFVVNNNFHLQEDLQQNGNWADITGNLGSSGYVGMAACELIWQEFSEPLVAGDAYVIELFVRFPGSVCQTSPPSGLIPQMDAPVILEVGLFNGAVNPYYTENRVSCEDGDCSPFFVSGPPPQLLEEIVLDPSSLDLVPGEWHKIRIPFFVAEKDWTKILIQTVSVEENWGETRCDSYVLLDDIKLYSKSGCSHNCGDCSFTSGIKNVGINQINTGTEPLTVFNLENVDKVNWEIRNFADNLITVGSDECSNGWTNGDLQIDLPSMGYGWYWFYLIVSNDCGICVKKIQWLYEDDYAGSFNSCECREEGIIKPCCEDQYDAEQYVQTCQTGTLLYQAINDLKVGFNSDFTVENGTDVYFTANNSIEFGPNFKSENNGTFLAEITACSQNKKGNDDFVQKDDNPFKEDESREDLIQCFPNPSNGFINVLTRFDSNSELTIFSVLGERLGQHTIHGKELTQIELHAAGVYIFSFSSNGTVINKEVIIQ